MRMLIETFKIKTIFYAARRQQITQLEIRLTSISPPIETNCDHVVFNLGHTKERERKRERITVTVNLSRKRRGWGGSVNAVVVQDLARGKVAVVGGGAGGGVKGRRFLLEISSDREKDTWRWKRGRSGRGRKGRIGLEKSSLVFSRSYPS